MSYHFSYLFRFSTIIWPSWVSNLKRISLPSANREQWDGIFWEHQEVSMRGIDELALVLPVLLPNKYQSWEWTVAIFHQWGVRLCSRPVSLSIIDYITFTASRMTESEGHPANTEWMNLISMSDKSSYYITNRQDSGTVPRTVRKSKIRGGSRVWIRHRAE